MLKDRKNLFRNDSKGKDRDGYTVEFPLRRKWKLYGATRQFLIATRPYLLPATTKPIVYNGECNLFHWLTKCRLKNSIALGHDSAAACGL